MVDFRNVLTGGRPQDMGDFVVRWRDTRLEGFCKELEKDEKAAKNAVSTSLNSAFVEGDNNKIKVTERIPGGRSSLRTLQTKCIASFQVTKEADFGLGTVIHYSKESVL